VSIRLGRLASWGNLTGTPGTDLIVFVGTGQITDVKSTWPQRFTPQFMNPLVMANARYPIDTAGLSAMPYASPPTVVYDIIFLAPSNLSDAASFQYVGNQLRQFDTFIKGTYTLDSVTNVSGLRGWLKVLDEDESSGLSYKAKARFLEGPIFELAKGTPSEMHATLVWGLLTEWAPNT
jgi:hypothetical protein